MNRKLKNIRYFNYASVDFLIDKNGMPVFMEVNDNTLAPFYIEQKNLLTQKVINRQKGLINLNSNHKSAFLACFDNYFNEQLGITGNKEKSIAILCKRRDHPQAIENEINYLIHLFRENGYSADMHTPEDCEINHGQVTIKKNKKVPSVIFRRNFSYPPSGVKQPVTNDLMVRKISGNKFLTHQVIGPLVKSGDTNFRQPKTYYVKDQVSLVKVIEKFAKNNSDCIAKPNFSYGGDGFFYFSKSENILEGNSKINEINERLKKGEHYLVQEKIESSLFKSGNNQEYCFDIRLMIYGGRFAGIEGRRSNQPFNSNSNIAKSFVTNINSGGKDLIVMSTQNAEHKYESKRLIFEEDLDSMKFDVDSNILIIRNELFSKLKNAAEAIVKAIDEELQSLIG